MRIGELAKRSGVPPRTIRYYESIDLLAAPPRSDGGYRLYDDAALLRLDFIRKAQGLGLSLAEAREIARLRDGGAEPCAHMLTLLDRQIERVDHARDRLDSFMGELRRIKREAKGRAGARGAVCRIVDHARVIGIGELGPLLRPTSRR